jgi:hypothetical protein
MQHLRYFPGLPVRGGPGEALRGRWPSTPGRRGKAPVEWPQPQSSLKESTRTFTAAAM